MRDPVAIPPVLLGELRKIGVRLHVVCPLCSHLTYLDPNKVKGSYDTPIKELSSRLRCTKCLRKGGINVTEETIPWVHYLRRTGQYHRLTNMMRMVREEGSDE